MKSIGIVLALMASAIPGVHAQRRAPLTPILDSYGMLIGASRGGKWITAEKTHALLKKGEKIRLYTLKGYAGAATGGRPEVSEVSGQAYYIPLPQKDQPTNEETIGLGGAWNPMPRLSRAENAAQPVYLNAVAVVLQAKGLAGVKPNIVRIVRVDLLGKGQDAVLIEAASPNYKLATGFESDPPDPNTYSCVILRMIKDGKLTTTVLGGAFYGNKGAKGPAERYNIQNILDLNGDGVLEIVVRSHYYEGGGSAVFEVKSGVPKQVLDAGDGA